MMAAYFPVCVSLLQCATKHTKNKLKTNALTYFLCFLRRAFWYNYTTLNKEMQNAVN